MLISPKHLLSLSALVLGLLPTYSSAQTITHNAPGYVVMAQGDTLRGLLSVPRFASDEGITFRTTAQAATQKFDVQALRAFGLQDGRRFVRRNITAFRNPETGVVDSATVFLQHLVGGTANFYRYDFATVLHRAQTDETRSEAVQFYLDLGGHHMVRVQRVSQNAALAAVFQDCPAVVAAVPRTPFNERRLSNLALRYDTLCHRATPAHDYRLPEPPSTVQLLVSLHAGLQNGRLFYPSSTYLPRAEVQAANLPAFALELRLANKGPWSLISGLHYAALRGETTQTQPAQLGTTNTGQQLSLPHRVEARSLQLPLLLRYTFGTKGLRPYLAAGGMIGTYLDNQTTLSYTTLTYVGGTSVYYRNDVITIPVPYPGKNHQLISGVVRAGLQLKTKSRLSPSLEIQYSAGHDSEDNPGLPIVLGLSENIGRLHYQALSVMAGLEF